MPSKALKVVKAPVKPSESRDLIKVGPKTVSAKPSKGVRDANGERPTTARALILRNGKYGARGTGELQKVTHITGREKLDLLAEDLVSKSKNTVMSPLKLEHCWRIASSQLNSCIDEIANLQDPDLFFDLIQTEYHARTPPQSLSDKNNNVPSKWRDAAYISTIVAIRIHNAYMLASAWKLVGETLDELERYGVSDDNIRDELKASEEVRSKYLALYDMINILVDVSQTKFSVLATTTSHYAQYFKAAENSDKTDTEVKFDWAGAGVREACKSFLDSIIIELCFPRAPYPKQVLYQILREAIEEAPREAKRFPQALWDALGDLSVVVELQELIESPLIGIEGESLKSLPREMPKPYEKWIDAQRLSDKATNHFVKFKDTLYPLEQMKTRTNLDNLWKNINTTYKSISGMDINTLWQVEKLVNRAPTWHAFHIPYTEASDDEGEDGPSSKMPFNTKGSTKRKPLAIANQAANDSDGSMPALQSVSNSSESEPSESEDSDIDEEDSGDEEDDEGYNTEEEDEIRDMLREAMDTAHEADIYGGDPSNDPFQDERKTNPFLKLLGSLRGRMFSGGAKLRTTKRTEPLSATEKLAQKLAERPKPATKPAPATTSTKGGIHKTTMEEVDDEDDATTAAKKKKKKKPKKKKKKKAATPGDDAEESDSEDEAEPAPVATTASPAPAPAPTPVSPTTPAKKTPAPTAKSPTRAKPATPGVVPPHMSTASLLPTETAAQSARSYLQKEKLDETKVKVKSRPAHGSLFGSASNFLGRFTGKNDKNKPIEPEKKGAKHSWFSKLGKKTAEYMHQLLRTSEDGTQGLTSMKWENFLKLMREMGFKYDPSTAGSSVRFDPPNPKDRSITFHKPHPDPTLTPILLKEFSKRLVRCYGWTEEDFRKAL